jgi:alanyl-tRNA synthetase
VQEMFIQHCGEYEIPFNLEKSIRPHDDTTLFCCSGMQQFKSKFKDQKYLNTISNIQPCLRLNDIEEIGDGTHLLYFNMIGLFSFRQWTVKESIDFWMDFLINKLELKIDYVQFTQIKLINGRIIIQNILLKLDLTMNVYGQTVKWVDTVQSFLLMTLK